MILAENFEENSSSLPEIPTVLPFIYIDNVLKTIMKQLLLSIWEEGCLSRKEIDRSKTLCTGTLDFGDPCKLAIFHNFWDF